MILICNLILMGWGRCLKVTLHTCAPENFHEVQTLPFGVAAERSVHYLWDYFSFFFFLPGHILFSKKGLSMSQGSKTLHGFFWGDLTSTLGGDFQVLFLLTKSAQNGEKIDQISHPSRHMRRKNSAVTNNMNMFVNNFI